MDQRNVIRIKTETYCDSKKQIVVKKTIRQMRRLSGPKGPYVLEEEVSQVGVDALNAFRNILDLSDGLYWVYIVHRSVDHWTGAVDDVEYGLAPFYDPDEEFPCPSCDVYHKFECEPEEFDPDMHYCGCGPRCCP